MDEATIFTCPNCRKEKMVKVPCAWHECVVSCPACGGKYRWWGGLIYGLPVAMFSGAALGLISFLSLMAIPCALWFLSIKAVKFLGIPSYIGVFMGFLYLFLAIWVVRRIRFIEKVKSLFDMYLNKIIIWKRIL
jgi:hypothetical protein